MMYFIILALIVSLPILGEIIVDIIKALKK